MRRIKKITVSILALTFVVVFAFLSVGCSAKSAYEIAVKHGFVGTEAEWINSLKGQDGQNAVQFDIYEIYEQFKEENPTVSFEQFLSTYLAVNTSAVDVAASIALRSAVSIFCKFTTKGSGITNPSQTYYSAGSGVVYSLDKAAGDGYVITNFHVVYDADSNTVNKISNDIKVYFFGREYEDFGVSAKYIGGSSVYDIAVLKISGADLSATAAQAVRLGDSNNIAYGQSIIAVGNPEAEGLSVVAGIVSVDSENIEMESITDASSTFLIRVMRIDAPINSGNSGGGLFDVSGRLVGIVNAKTVQEDIEGMCYAIPLSTALGVADSVIDGFNKKVKLGVSVVVHDSKAVYDVELNRMSIVETLRVTSVESGSIAYNVVKEDDYLRTVKINSGEEVTLTRSFQLADYLFKARTGDVITLKVLRDGQEKTLSMTVIASKLAEL